MSSDAELQTVSPPPETVDTPRPGPTSDRPHSFSSDFLTRFRPIRPLGKGAMGAVYLMQQLSLERPVAVKVVRDESLSAADIKRLIQEARILGSLKHPNILAVHDVGTDGSFPYMVCEYVDGETIGHRLARGRLEVHEALKLGMEILDGLESAHRQSVIHRDLKPGNIFLDRHGRPIIGDFGLAKSHDAQSGTAAGRILGTPAYMSPEQCRGHSTTAASDLYSMGIVLFEMLTGTRPFGGPSLLDYLNQHTTQAPPRARSVRPELPAAVDGILLQALEKDPARRFASAAAMKEALQDIYQAITAPRATPRIAETQAPVPLAPEPRAGVKLGNRYELVRVLGAGGMGQVWLAHDVELERDAVAIKLLPVELWRDPEARANLKQEARLSVRLSHPNVMRLMTLESGDPPYLVMEYVGGGTLADELGRRKEEGLGPFKPHEAMPLLEGIAAGLDHAHQKNLIHRDIKPSNVLLARDGSGAVTPKIADFGIAAEVSSFRTRSTGAVPAGTLAYMSPEQVSCQKLDARSDVYSLAALAYQMLTFDPPFIGGDISSAIKHEPVPPPDGVPAPLAAAVLRGLAKKRDDRPQSVAALIAELKAAAAGAPPAHAAPPTPPVPPVPPARSSGAPKAAIAGVLAIAAIGALAAFRPHLTPPSDPPASVLAVVPPTTPASHAAPALPKESPLPKESALPKESPLPKESALPKESPLPKQSPIAPPPPPTPAPATPTPPPTPAPTPPPTPAPTPPPTPAPPAAPSASPTPAAPPVPHLTPFSSFHELSKITINESHLTQSDLSPDDRSIVVQSETEGALRIYDLATGKLTVRHAPPASKKKSDLITRLVSYWPRMSPPRLLIGLANGLFLHDAATNAEVAQVCTQPSDRAMTWSQARKFLVVNELVQGGNGVPWHSLLRFYRVKGDAELEPILSHEYSEGVAAVALDDKRQLAYVLGLHSGRLAKLDWTSESRLWEIPTGLRYPTAVALSPDGRAVAIAGEKLTLIDTGDTSRRGVLGGFGNNIDSMAFSPDGGAIAVAAYDGAVRLVSSQIAEKLALLATLKHARGNVYGPHWTTDGKKLVTTGGDGTVRVWGAAR